MKPLIQNVLPTIILLFLSFGAQAQVLGSIETYKAPPYPKSGYIEKETYDYRVESGESVPPTLTDAFICDIWDRIKTDLNITIMSKDINEDMVTQAFNIYLSKDWRKIAGYRPWTHWNFIRNMSKKKKLETLATEVVSYVKEHGAKYE